MRSILLLAMCWAAFGCSPQPPRLTKQWCNRTLPDVFSVAFGPDGKTVASSSGGPAVYIWDSITGAQIRTLGPKDDCASTCLAWLPDGTTIVSGNSWQRVGSVGHYAVDLFDVSSGRIRASLGCSDRMTCVAVSPDGATIASAGDDCVVQLWRVTDFTKIATIQTGYVRCMAFSPDGKTLVTADNSGRRGVAYPAVQLWDVASGKRLAAMNSAFLVWTVAFSPDGKTIASAGEDAAITLWDAVTRTKRADLKSQGSYIYSVAFSPDGKLLATAVGDGMIELWCLASGKRIASAPVTQCLYLAFSPDSKRLVGAGGKTGGVILWSIK